MDKEKLIDEISGRVGIAKKEVGNIINTAIRVIEDTLSKGEKVTLLDFGTFTPAVLYKNFQENHYNCLFSKRKHYKTWRYLYS